MKNFFKANRFFLIPFLCWWTVFGGSQLFHSQTDIILFINANWTGLADFLFPVITYGGDGLFTIGVTLVVFLLSYRVAITIILACASSGLLVVFLKKVVFAGAYRPPKIMEAVLPAMHQIPHVDMLYYNSFPSGHTTSAFALFSILAFECKNPIGKLLLLLAAILVGFSRMYLLAHFPEDVLAGSLLGVFFAVICTLYVNHLWLRKRNSGLLNHIKE